MTIRPPLAPLALALLAPLAYAQHEITTSYGIDFVTVGDLGNADSTVDDIALGIPSLHTPRGGVDYEFRIGRTEITTGQWFEFVEAYLPFYEGPSFGTPGFRSQGIILETLTREPVMVIPEDRPALVGWQYAARFANWLHNDRANEAWAFETGVYDTSTWALGPNGEPPADPDVSAHPDARFRLPTPDEWTKTVFYDPDRYGEGEGGYWPYPYASSTPLISTDPGLGGQSDVGLSYGYNDPDAPESSVSYPYGPVGSYPDANAPWGALDVSGSLSEWLDSISPSDAAVGVVASQRFAMSFDSDSLELSLTGVNSASAVSGASTHGFRLVSVIPSPGGGVALVIGALVHSQRRRT